MGTSREERVEALANATHFLFHIMEDKGENWLYGGVTVREAFDGVCRLAGVDHDRLLEKMREDWRRPI